MADIQYCKKCGLYNWHVGNKEKLKIDEDICEICRQSEKKTRIVQKREPGPLDTYFAEEKGKYDYDCIVLFTGGRDSSYSFQLLKERYHLKILALTWDNGFFSEEHRQNIERVTKMLQVEHQYLDVDWNVVKAIYQNRLRYLGRFCNCVPLVFLFAAPVILQKKAPAVVFSISVAQTINAVMKEFGSESSDEVLAEKIALRGISGISNIAKEMYDILCVDLLAGEYDKEVLDKIKPCVKALIQMKEREDISLITPSCFFEWKEKEMCDSLASMGWKIGDSKESYNHSSCMAEEIKSYLSFQQQQINMDILEFSYLRRNNIIDEKQYEDLIEKGGYSGKLPAYWNEFLKKVDIPEDEMIAILNNKVGTRSSIKLNMDTAAYLGFENPEKLNGQVERLFKTRILI